MNKITTGTLKKSMRKVAYIQRFGIKHTLRRDRDLDSALMSQLSYCKSDEARRLILGVSEKEEA